jgi:hypothetical protein
MAEQQQEEIVIEVLEVTFQKWAWLLLALHSLCCSWC